MLLVTATLWLPFGLRTVGLVEEWDIMGILAQGHQLFFLTRESPLGEHGSRPLGVLVYALAYAITPNSFDGLHALEGLLFFGKTCAVYACLVTATRGRLPAAYAAVGALLFAVYPADTGLFALRDMPVHAAIFAYIAAAACLLAAWRGSSALPLLGVAVLLPVSLLMYEVCYPLALVTPLLLPVLDGGLRRRSVGLGMGWWAVLFACAGYGVLTVAGATSSVSGTLVQESLASVAQLRLVAGAILRAYRWQFGDAWREAVEAAAASPSYLAISLGLAGLLGLLALRLPGGLSAPRPPAVSVRTGTVLVVLGLFVLGVGYLPFAIVPSHRAPDLIRVYLLSSLGAALAIVGLVTLLSARLRGIIGGVALLGILALALTHAFAQHQHYQTLARAQQRFLGEMVEQAPAVAPGTTVVVVDQTGLLDDEWFFGVPFRLTLALQYLYSTPALEAVLCYPPSAQWQTAPTGRGCQFGANSLTITAGAEGDRVITRELPYTSMLVFEYRLNDELRLLDRVPAPYLTAAAASATYRPAATAPASSGLSPRQQGLLPCWPVESCTPRPTERLFPAVSRLHYDFDGTERVGVGWRAAEVYPDGLSFRWTVAPQAALNFRLEPGRDYTLAFRVNAVLATEVLDQLSVSVNGTPLATTSEPDPQGGRVYRASLPGSVLRPPDEVNEAVLSVPRTLNVPGTAVYLGVAVDWLDIAPAAR